MTAGGNDRGTGGGNRALRASRNPNLDRTDAAITRLLQYPAPRPHPVNRTAMEQVRA